MSDQSFTRKIVSLDSELYSQYQNCDRWAVVVGISKYQHSIINLKYADQDAESLHQLLLTPNGGSFQSDHICKLTNEQATTGNITRALRSFLKKPAREDLVLIYLAGHGSPDPDRPDDVYFLTYDTDPNDIAGTALPMEDIHRAMKSILHSEKVIILADTCHSAAIGSGIGGRRSVVDDTRLMNRFLQNISQSKGGVALLTSAEANEVSFEDSKWGGGHGVFTHYLLEGMRGAADQDADGLVTIGELFEYVRDNVKKATNYRQHPSIGQNAYDRKMPVAVAPNARFSTNVENLDVTFEISLTAEEMTAGAERHIVTEQGGIVIKIPPGVSPGKRIRVRGKGRFDPSTQQRGHLYLLINRRDSLPERGPSALKTFAFQVPTISTTQGFPQTKLEISYQPGRAEYFKEDLGGGIVLEMVAIPSGSFQMGSTEEDGCDDEKPVHKVAVQSFYMGKFAITQAQWRAVAALPQVNHKLDPDPSGFKGNKHPVENVSWYKAVEFCNRLSQKTGKTYRLPSEAVWEYACRARTTTPFYCGETITTDLANYRGTDWEYEGRTFYCGETITTDLANTYSGSYGAGPKGEFRYTTTPVDQFGGANAFGLCDMHGNVLEWCQDHYHENYQAAPSNGSAWLTDNEGANRLLRGGSWYDNPWNCRSACRSFGAPGRRFNGVGFRVSCSAPRT